ncbi:hypothetical protein [Pseudaeromonas paramecii]|uniref:Uncharacterized protein n=1 Tax=Pseudaeromonas paramecii TaxID=2138166 RepID=A0ABP8Q1P7_9GAMM
MELHLTEISSAYLFTEYLHNLGAKVPRFKQDWEFTVEGKIMAKVKVCQEGRPRYYISASHMGPQRSAH